MNAGDALTPGMQAETAITVASEHTAPHVGSGVVPVLATPVMVNMMEAAALAAVEKHLPAGYQTLGTLLQVEHVAATPVGMGVRVTATLTAVDGRKLRFELAAHDDHERIGGGVHERVVVNGERFEERVRRKAGGA